MGITIDHIVTIHITIHSIMIMGILTTVPIIMEDITEDTILIHITLLIGITMDPLTIQETITGEPGMVGQKHIDLVTYLAQQH